MSRDCLAFDTVFERNLESQKQNLFIGRILLCMSEAFHDVTDDEWIGDTPIIITRKFEN